MIFINLEHSRTCFKWCRIKRSPCIMRSVVKVPKFFSPLPVISTSVMRVPLSRKSWSPFLSPNGLFLSSPTCRSGTSQTNLRIIPPVKFNPCSSSAIKFPFKCRQRIVDYLSSLDYTEKYYARNHASHLPVNLY